MKDKLKLNRIIKPFFLFSVLLSFISCSNIFNQDINTKNTETSDGKTYLKIQAVTNGSSRTIYPDNITIEDFLNFRLIGKYQDENDYHLLFDTDNTEKLKNTSIEVTAGQWTFTLSATYNSPDFGIISFSDTAVINIQQKTITPVVFNLKPDGEKGSFSISFDLSADTNVDAAKAYLKTLDGLLVDSETYSLPETIDPPNRIINYSKDAIAPGTYLLQLDFFAGGDPTPLNQWESYIYIRGLTKTTSSVTLDFNETYTISYLDEDGNSIDLSKAKFLSGIAISKYSNRSSFDLPVLRDGGYIYKWQIETTGEEITRIDAGTTGDLTIKAYDGTLAETVLYVKKSGNDTTGIGSETKPFKTIDGASDFITNYNNPDSDWTIYVDGKGENNEITGIPQGSSGNAASYGTSNLPSSLDGKANSILLTGATEPEAVDKLPQDIIDAKSTGTVLKINTSVPVTITNLKITGGLGSGDSGAGIFVSEASTVMLGNGVWIIKNRAGSNTHGGGIHNEGTLFIYGSAIIGDKSIKEYAWDSSTDSNFSTTSNRGGEGGGCYNGNSSNSSTVVAKLYLGYKGFASDGVTPVKEEFTGGFYHNGGNGGGLYNAKNCFVYFDTGFFEWNGTCDKGGAIANAGTIEMTGGQILHNRSYEGEGFTSYGGGVCNLKSTSVFIMRGGIINKNLAQSSSGYGGGVYNCGQFYMCGTAVIGEENYKTVATSDDWGNKAQLGGGIYNYVNNASSENGCLYLGYKLDDVGNLVREQLTGGIYHNYAFSTSGNTGGGGIGSVGTLEIDSGTIAYNSTSNNGGGICSKSLVISGGVIENNTADGKGNAIYVETSSTYKLTLSGTPKIPASSTNDIYLAGSRTYNPSVFLTSSLPSTFTAQLSFDDPDTTVTAISATDSSISLANECTKFTVTPQTIDGLINTIPWYVGTNGKLQTTPVNIDTMNISFNVTVSDIAVTAKVDGEVISTGSSFIGNIIEFTADEGYSSYEWSIDNVVQTSTSNILSVNTSSWKKGVYDIVLEATDSSDNKYSYFAQIKKSTN